MEFPKNNESKISEINYKKIAFSALINGKVQKVGFRFFSVRKARRLGVKGWVKNLPSGDVEVWAEGSEEALSQFFVWLHKGPLFARVNSVKKEEKEQKGYEIFYIEH